MALGAELYDVYAGAAGGFESYQPPQEVGQGAAQHGHVSVDRRRVLEEYGLRWEDVPTGGQHFGEDIRFVKAVIRCGGRRNDSVAVVAANLTLYQPSWAAEKRCVVGQRILYGACCSTTQVVK